METFYLVTSFFAFVFHHLTMEFTTGTSIARIVGMADVAVGHVESPAYGCGYDDDDDNGLCHNPNKLPI